jgi:hypothetical protein
MTDIASIITVIGTVSGVVIGFAFSQIAEAMKSKHHESKIKQAVVNELTVALNVLEKAKKQGIVYSIKQDDFPLVSDAYDCLKIELASSLDPAPLAALNKAYLHIRALNCKREDDSSRGYVLISDTNYGVCYTHDLEEDKTLIKAAIKNLS